MTNKITTLIIDMYGVILKERTGNFISYTFEHFEKSRHGELRKKFDEERLFIKAGYGELSSHDLLSLLGYQDTEYHMKNYIENYLSIDEAFIGFAEKYYQKFDFVLLSTDVSEWSAYITRYYKLNKYFKYKIVSGDVHCRKPDKKIYEITLQRILVRCLDYQVVFLICLRIMKGKGLLSVLVICPILSNAPVFNS